MIKENQKEECIKKKVEGGNEGDSLAAGAADEERGRERRR